MDIALLQHSRTFDTRRQGSLYLSAVLKPLYSPYSLRSNTSSKVLSVQASFPHLYSNLTSTVIKDFSRLINDLALYFATHLNYN
jgi:hypothetical protein